MRGRWKKWFVALAVTAVAMAVFPVDEAAARRPKLVAKIHGRRFKSNRKVVLASVNSIVFSIGGAVVPRRLRATARAIGIVCLVDNLATQPLPLTLQCGADYYELKLTPGAPRHQWDTATGIQVTVLSFDGTRLRGTFQGTLEIVGPTHPEDPPATVEGGRFDAIVNIPS